MLAEADREARTLRLDDEGLAALVDADARPEVPRHPGLETALAGAGLGPALAAVEAAVVRLELVVAGRDGRLEHRAWLSEDTLALALGVRAGLHQVQVSDPAFLTAALVRLTRMTPRRPSGDRAPMPYDVGRVLHLVHCEADLRRAALDELGADQAWRLQVTWETGSREAVAVDGPQGLFLLDPETGWFRPVSNTMAYRVLSTVLPGDALA